MRNLKVYSKTYFNQYNKKTLLINSCYIVSSTVVDIIFSVIIVSSIVFDIIFSVIIVSSIVFDIIFSVFLFLPLFLISSSLFFIVSSTSFHFLCFYSFFYM